MAEGTPQEFLTGRVKWFNNKSGYGFITCMSDGDHKDEDIFAHYSQLHLSGGQQYCYLVQGEYVEFILAPLDNPSESKQYQASGIRGIMGGELMCETIRAQKQMRSQRTRTEQVETDTTSSPEDLEAVSQA